MPSSNHSPLRSNGTSKAKDKWTPIVPPKINTATNPISIPVPIRRVQPKVQNSLTSKYYTSTARTKLGIEVDEEHRLRRLVGHANMLDRLEDEIAEAERIEKLAYQGRLVKQPTSPTGRSIFWADSIPEEDEDGGSSEDEEEELLELVRMPRYSLPGKKGVSGGGRKVPEEPVLLSKLPVIAEGILEKNDWSAMSNVLQSLDRSFGQAPAVVKA